MDKDKAKVKDRDRDQAMEDLIQESATPLEADIHQAAEDRDIPQVAVILQRQGAGCHHRVDILEDIRQMATEAYTPVDTHLQITTEVDIPVDIRQTIGIHLDIQTDIHPDRSYRRKTGFRRQETAEFQHSTQIDSRQGTDTRRTKYTLTIPEILR